MKNNSNHYTEYVYRKTGLIALITSFGLSCQKNFLKLFVSFVLLSLCGFSFAQPSLGLLFDGVLVDTSFSSPSNRVEVEVGKPYTLSVVSFGDTGYMDFPFEFLLIYNEWGTEFDREIVNVTYIVDGADAWAWNWAGHYVDFVIFSSTPTGTLFEVEYIALVAHENCIKLQEPFSGGNFAYLYISAVDRGYIVDMYAEANAYMDDPYRIKFSIESTLDHFTTANVKIKEDKVSPSVLPDGVQEETTVWKLYKDGNIVAIDDNYNIRAGEAMAIDLEAFETVHYYLEGKNKWNWLPDWNVAAPIISIIDPLNISSVITFLRGQKEIEYRYTLSVADISSATRNIEVIVPPGKMASLISSGAVSLFGSNATLVGIPLIFLNPIAATAAFVIEAAAIVESRDLYNVANDPPDFNYTEIALPEIPDIAGLSQVDDPELRYICDIAIELAATSKAMLTSLERHEGAKIDGDDYYANLQYYVYNSYAERCSELSAMMSENIDPLVLMLPELTLESVQQGHQYIAQNGLPAIEVEILTAFGFSPEEIAIATEAYLSFPDDFFLSVDFTLKDYRETVSEGYANYVQLIPEPDISNAPPTADAGEYQAISVDDNCTADVILDGSNSYDFEGSDLTYSWRIDGQEIAVGVGPVVELGLGVHVIGLVVNDWLEDSLADEVVVTVEDTTAPEITLNGDAVMAFECGIDNYVEAGATAVDNCSGVVAVVTGGDAVDTSNVGVYEVTYTASDAAGNTTAISRVVNIVDTTAPSLDVTVTPEMLWPPNHKMVKIEASKDATDNSGIVPSITLLSITMNEGEETNTYDPGYDVTLGDGNTTDDIQVDSDGNIYLRAERSGKGDGRVYTIIYQAEDASGNTTQGTATVTVPHSQP